MANIIDLNGRLMLTGQEADPVTRPPLLLESRNTETTVENVTSPKQERPKDDQPLLIQTPIFILFAEYLGYVSKLVEFAEDWCDIRKPMPSKMIQTLLDREARTIYDEMLEEFTEEQIHEFYETLYPCSLDEIEEDLIQKRKENGEDLPF